MSSTGPPSNGLVCSRWREKYQNTPQKVFRLQADAEVPEEGIRGDIGKLFFCLIQPNPATVPKVPKFRLVFDWYQVRKQPPDS